MRTYDTIAVWTECPYCGTHKSFKAQTKDLDKSMETYGAVKRRQRKSYKEEMREDLDEDTKDTLKGLASLKIDNSKCYVPDKYKGEVEELRASFTCDSVQCQFDGDRDWILSQGTPSGAGRYFQATIKVEDDGMIMNELSEIELDGKDREKLAEYKKEYPEIYEYLKEKYEHEPIITRNWREGKKAVEKGEE